MAVSKFTADVRDNLVSFAAGLGDPGRDKSVGTFYAPQFLTDLDLFNVYDSTWLGQKIIDIPADDSTSKGRQWLADEAQITLIEGEQNRLGLMQKVNWALKMARLWGGAGIYINNGDMDPTQPLDPARVRKGGILSLHVITRRQVYVPALNWDILSPDYSKPYVYVVANQGSAGVSVPGTVLAAAPSVPQVVIHPSRIVRFIGREHPDPMMTGGGTNYGWGNSVINTIYNALRNADGTAQNIASLIFEANVDVFKIKELWETLANPSDEQELIKRFQIAAAIKGNNRALILDATDEYERKAFTFTGMPDVLQAFLQIAAGAADIPATRLLSQSPGGMNATGDSDLNNYYDRVLSDQNNKITPALSVLDECLIRSALGTRPSGISYAWTPLKQMTEAEKSTAVNSYASAVSAMVNAGIFQPNVIAPSVVNQISEMGVLPGLSKDFAANPTPEPEPLDLGGGDPTREDPLAANLNDMSPRSMYVSRKVLNGAEILAWARGQGIAPLEAVDDLHVTVMYCPKAVDWMSFGEDFWNTDGTFTIAPGGPRAVSRFDGNAIVLEFSSSNLSYRNGSMQRKINEDDEPRRPYAPHITVAYDEGWAINVEGLTAYQGKILLGPEIFAEIGG